MAKRTEGAENWDFSKIWGNFDMPQMPEFPALKMDEFAATQQRNFEAFATSQRMAMEGFQAIAQRNAEFLRDSYETSAKFAQSNAAPMSPQDGMTHQAAYCKEALETGIDNAREITGMVRATADQAMRVVADRMTEGFSEFAGSAPTNSEASAKAAK